MSGDARATLPSVSAVLAEPALVDAVTRHGHGPVVAAVRHIVDAARARLDDGGAGASAPAPTTPGAAELAQAALAELAARERLRLRPVVNATGVLLHTNLGRAPLSDAALAAATAAGRTTNLEIDLASGRRGGRERAARDALARLTGAEDALLVNNCAAALMLALHAHAHGEPVAISRGELVEIGGSFRIPEIVAASGARLMEVGTTNRTRADDYRRAIAAGARAVLRVHPSNYRVDGFTARASDEELAAVAREAGVPFLNDVGSGLLPGAAATLADRIPDLADEPRVDAAVRVADLVVFSGDKLLGGPQVGVIVGRSEMVAACARAPFARALRIDKLHLAAVEETLAAHERGTLDELPLFAMTGADLEGLRERAERIAAACAEHEVAGTIEGPAVVAAAMDAVLGGGSLPGLGLPSYGVAVTVAHPDALARRLRLGDPAVVARIEDDRVLLDLRTVPPEMDVMLAAAVLQALGADD